MTELEPLIGLGVFASSFGVNFLGSLAMRRTTEGKALQAATLDVGVLALSSLAVYAFINNPAMLLPEAVGCWLGSYSCIKLDSRKRVRP